MTTEDRRDDQTEVPPEVPPEMSGVPEAPDGATPTEGSTGPLGTDAATEANADASESAPEPPRAERRLFGRFRRRGEAEPPAPPLVVEPPPDLPEPEVALRPAVSPTARQVTEAPPVVPAVDEVIEVEVPRPRPVAPSLVPPVVADHPTDVPPAETPLEPSEPAPAEDAPIGPAEEAAAAEAMPSLIDPEPERDAAAELPPESPPPPPMAPLPPLPPPSIRRPVPLTAQMTVITLLATAVTLAFVLIEPSPRWWLIVGAAAVVFGMDGVLRAAWREPFASGQETAPFLFLPALYMLATPVLIEHNARGEWAVLMGLAAGLGFGIIVWGEVASVRPAAAEYSRARLAVTALAYFTAFAFFSLTYVFQIGLLPAMIAVGLAATMLSIELLREGEIDPLETMGFALIGGIVVAEGRWLIHYLPLDRYMAGLTLLVVFYLVTGIVHSYITRQFTPRLALETTFLAAATLALVVIARAGGMA